MPHPVPVDVLIIMEQDGHVLLLERANTGYADGTLIVPSGRLEDGEDVVTAAIREGHEEVGVRIDSADIRTVNVMQHRSPEGVVRIGWFFAAARWDGAPRNAEPERCARLLWVPTDQLPGHTYPYTAAGIEAYRRGLPYTLHGFGNEPTPI